MISLILAALLGTAQAAVELNTKNTVLLRAEVNDFNMDIAALELTRLSELRGTKKYPIYLVVDSGGGSVDSGLNFIEFAKTVPNVETITLNAASMASAIVQALPGRRHILSNGTHMYHRAKGQFRGQFETGEVESQLKMAQQLILIMERQNAKRLKMSLAAYKAAVVNELWFVGAQAVSSNSADDVVTIRCTPALMKERTPIAEQGFLGQSVMFYSKCPLIRSQIVSEAQTEEMRK